MLYKGGNRNQTSKDHMIMIRSCMAEFPGSIVEHQIGETRLKNTEREVWDRQPTDQNTTALIMSFLCG